ncbi:hypothetical protein LIER_31686 [Lithospermum erythrorhizon]|uniref:Uncharacterized protein n=1 Tax=Lithospermum erythrorhizon TaxID=34254 RepID=A0AAV3RRQ7_LITER
MKLQQKCMQDDATRKSLAIRKGKRDGKMVENKVKEEDTWKIVEERRECDVQWCNDNGQALLEDINGQWEESSFSWKFDDVEQMPYWCTSWCPLWDVECMADLYNDVVWEDDIWDLKATKNVPSP